MSAFATIRHAIFDRLIVGMPRASYPYLEQAAEVAAEALKEPSIAWVLSDEAKAEVSAGD